MVGISGDEAFDCGDGFLLLLVAPEELGFIDEGTSARVLAFVVFTDGIVVWDGASGGDITGGIAICHFAEAIIDDVADEAKNGEDPNDDQFFLIGIKKGLKS